MATIKYKDGADWKYLPLGGPSAVLMDTWHTVNDGATGLGTTYGSGVVSTGAQPLQFRKSLDGKVLLRGACSCPTATGSILFRLPVGYRPPADFVRFIGANAGDTTAAMYYVTALGDVIKATAAATADISCVEFDTDTVTMFPMAGVGLPPRVTALPTSPSDGQEVYYVASAADGVLWHLKYNAASASAYKWEFVGGPPLEHEAGTNALAVGSHSISSATYGDLTTGPTGPELTTPLAGEYLLTIEADMLGSPGYATMSYAIGATVAAGTDCMFNASSAWTRNTKTKRKVLPAATLIRAKYSATSGTGSFSDRVMKLLPVRVG